MLSVWRGRLKPVELSTVGDWLRAEVEKHPYWFQQIELAPGLVTPGWSKPKVEKLPYFGLPDDMNNMRVLDIGCSEGFFSFEAERRGAKEVIAIDSSPDSINRFNLCRTALNSKVNAYLATVYDLNTRVFGTISTSSCSLAFSIIYAIRCSLCRRFMTFHQAHCSFKVHILKMLLLMLSQWRNFIHLALQAAPPTSSCMTVPSSGYQTQLA